MRGEGARAAAAATGPRRAIPHGMLGIRPAVLGPSVSLERLGAGSVSFVLFFINTVFWSGTCFASVSAARLAGRRLWLKESMKKSLLQKNERSYPHEDMDNSAPDWGSSLGCLKNCTFRFENPAPGKVRSVRGVRIRAFGVAGATMRNYSLYEHESSNPGPDLASFSSHSAVVCFESSKIGFSFKRQRPFCKNDAGAQIANC